LKNALLLMGLITTLAAAIWLLCAGVAHLIYKISGKKPDLYAWQSYRNFILFNRGLIGLAAVIGGLMVVGFASNIGRHITANMTGAHVTVVADTTHSGTYVRVKRDDLPKEARGSFLAGLSKNDVLFLEEKSHYGRRVVLIAGGDKEKLRKISKFQLYKKWHVERYPAPLFQWLGPIYTHQDLIIDQTGAKHMTSELYAWSHVKS
jgi:hypothetical protein